MTDPQASPRHPASIARPHWGAEALWQALVPLLPGLSIEVVQTLDSTNTELAERLRSASRVQKSPGDRRGGRVDDLFPQLLVAINQTAGRGRLGRRWHSTPGASLTFSLALPLARADWSGLSLAVGLAVVDALDAQGGRLGLKWPNDLILREPGDESGDDKGARTGRKLGGILIESVQVGEQRAAVIGIGINVVPQPVAEADYGTAALTELWPEATPQDTLARIGEPLVRTLLAFERDGFAPLQPAYASRDVLCGQFVRTSDRDMPEGVAAGVDADGALKVAADGQVRRIVSGEVSVRLAGAA
ncbi:biotin--[acetyl-CoA-carboxylase] ligase [Scleromatobacter humisilvae]|uniref:biotin--[biotin carboxyl-carrier protein] ligase n=1 Tax=Scleromatobacter humisilvae TaxID=2897159 RepID=A0A9X1YPC3_9BURK|nr:biotin--[acetyl-CoA-carboxylase] ligase [Scleromatobacter humisilvae]MCK9689577.1 biotin--[acetyl-CoA-carboxylase] ligase [Scleromatobacter humisilvae]